MPEDVAPMQERSKEVRLTSNDWWHAVGMVENYRRARQTGDRPCIKLFESAYPDRPKEFFLALANGNYKTVDDTVLVSY